MDIEELRQLKEKHIRELSVHIQQIKSEFQAVGVEPVIKVQSLKIESMGEPIKYAVNIDIQSNI